jgi:predicted flap endonuclease-1-like 5' DNA nuclease
MGAIGDFVANTAWLWYILFAILLLAATWWAFRRERTEKASVEFGERVRNESKASTDDLTKIEGIGPKVAKVLKDAGITTFDALARANAGEVQEVLNAAGLQMMNPEGWIEQAALAANNDWEGVEKLQGELKGGRRK